MDCGTAAAWLSPVAGGGALPANIALASAAALVALASAVALWTLSRATRRLPPLSLWNSMKLLINPSQLMEVMLRARQACGRVYSLLRGTKPVVVASDYDSIYEAFVTNGEHCSSRPPELSKIFFGGADNAGVICSPHWKDERRFALTMLRELGMGKVDLELRILDETKALAEVIARRCGTPFDVDKYVHRATSNIILSLVLGTRFDYEDAAFTHVIDGILNNCANIQKIAVLERLPILKLLKRIPGDVFGYHKFVRDCKSSRAFFSKAISQHAETLDRDNPRDFIDYYLIEMDKCSQSGQATCFDETNLLTTVFQLFIAGTDTTAGTLLWAWLYMIIHPDVQERVQEEIDKCIGARQPMYQDRLRMPYTEAVLTEVMRIGNTAAFTLSHMTDSDFSLAGYRIYKGMRVIASLASIHLDENVHPKPYDFNPNRFLDSQGNFQKPKHFLPFGIGRRSCLGENLARAELFLFFTSILQQYRLRSPKGVEVQPGASLGLTRKPLPYRIVFVPREVNIHMSAR